MHATLVAFASARDLLGAAEQGLELPAGTTLGGLIERVEAAHPELSIAGRRWAIAVEGEIWTDWSRTLPDGCEVAFLPPVSGGAPRAWLQDEPLALEAIAAEVSHPACGAEVTFVGRVRDHHDGRPVSGITYSAYDRLAGPTLETIASELERAHQARVRLVHRLGTLDVGEASIIIAIASAHRDAAFEACRQALERIKREVPIWKREHYVDGASAWREVEPLPQSASET